MSNLRTYFQLKQSYWLVLSRMQTNIEINDFDSAMTFFILSLMYEDELWEHLDNLTDEEKRFIFIL